MEDSKEAEYLAELTSLVPRTYSAYADSSFSVFILCVVCTLQKTEVEEALREAETRLQTTKEASRAEADALREQVHNCAILSFAAF